MGSRLQFGIINRSKLRLEGHELLHAIEEAMANFSYDPENPPDFAGFYQFIIDIFSVNEDLDILSRLIEVLSNIAGYRMGTQVGNMLNLTDNVNIKLLSSTNVNHVKASIDFFRKMVRVVGPRIVIRSFVVPNVYNVDIQRALTIITHQSIVDCPAFRFTSDDFGDWLSPLSSVVGVGERLVNLIKERLSQPVSLPLHRIPRPPTVPAISTSTNMPSVTEHVTRTLPVPPNSARPYVSKRNILSKRSAPEIPAIFQMTGKQKQVREFIDEPLGEKERPSDVIKAMLEGFRSPEWEDRCTSYNTYRRLLKYHNGEVTDESVHVMITAAVEDVTSQRAALSLATMAALQDSFVLRSQDMEVEISRILGVLISLHAKTAQFFLTSLGETLDIAVAYTSPKRFISVLVSSGEPKGSKIQFAMAKYLRESLLRCEREGNSLFKKNSVDMVNLIQILSKLCAGSLKETRDCAKEASQAATRILGDYFYQVAQRVLESRDYTRYVQSF